MESVSLPEFKGFEWDEGSADKNRGSHKMSPREAKQVFFSRPLFVAFTLRGDSIRVISARDIFDRPREPFDDHVIEDSTFAVHADSHLGVSFNGWRNAGEVN